MSIQTTNPATGEILKEFEPFDNAAIEQALDKADRAYEAYRLTSYDSRSEILQKAADILESEKDKFATIMTVEMGKTLASAKAEIAKCANLCRYYAEHAPSFLADETIETENTKSFISYQPIGIVLAIMPWNFPFWQVFRFAAPALMAGNVGLLKHASNVPQSALAIEGIFERAGLPDGCFQTLLIGSDKVENILKDNRVKAATLTGSEGAGRSVASIAGAQIKKTVLELGGSDPFIIMPSCDLDKAISDAVKARINNNGQTCIAAKRYIVHQEIYEKVKARLIKKFETLKVGNPMDGQTDVGPLSSAQIRDELDSQVQDSVAAGARILCGAHKIDGAGFYYQPGLLDNIPEGCPADIEELFGPVASLFKIKDIEEAVSIANKTRFGLGTAIYTNDNQEQDYAINNVEAGALFINKIVASDQRLPFGGIKSSGYGRELSKIGIHEFVNIKTVVIDE
tara:strand:+ start:888 stop:2255 length:1368 start_codon:yes stop_codon:yes gene_type:complete